MNAEAARIDTPRAHPIPEFAALARCSQAHIWNLIRRGEIRAVKLGRRTLIPASELNRLLGEVPDAASSRAPHTA